MHHGLLDRASTLLATPATLPPATPALPPLTYLLLPYQLLLLLLLLSAGTADQSSARPQGVPVQRHVAIVLATAYQYRLRWAGLPLRQAQREVSGDRDGGRGARRRGAPGSCRGLPSREGGEPRVQPWRGTRGERRERAAVAHWRQRPRLLARACDRDGGRCDRRGGVPGRCGAYREYRLLAYVPCFTALSHFQCAYLLVLTYSPFVSCSPTTRH